MFKWINVVIAFFTVPLNLWVYAISGNPINLIAAGFCLIIAIIGFTVCVAIENSFRR